MCVGAERMQVLGSKNHNRLSLVIPAYLSYCPFYPEHQLSKSDLGQSDDR
jgi:hypothetical protein